MVTIRHKRGQPEVALEWWSDPIADMIADACVAVIVGVESCPISVKSNWMFW